MIPETWLPTCTVVTAESVPVAVTVCVIFPWSTGAVRYLSSGFLRAPMANASPPAATTTITIQRILFFIRSRSLRAPKARHVQTPPGGTEHYTQTSCPLRKCPAARAFRRGAPV